MEAYKINELQLKKSEQVDRILKKIKKDSLKFGKSEERHKQNIRRIEFVGGKIDQICNDDNWNEVLQDLEKSKKVSFKQETLF